MIRLSCTAPRRLGLAALAFLAGTGFAAAGEKADTYRRAFLLAKKDYCATVYTTNGRWRTDPYCLKFYRELVERGIDGEAYAFYCDLKADEEYALRTDLLCNKAEALEEMRRMEERAELSTTEETARN